LDWVDDQWRFVNGMSDAETEAWHLSFVDVYLKTNKDIVITGYCCVI